MKNYAFGALLGAFIALTSCAPGFGDTGPNCTTGKRCGQTCIAKSKTCHVKHDEIEPEIMARAVDVAGQ